METVAFIKTPEDTLNVSSNNMKAMVKNHGALVAGLELGSIVDFGMYIYQDCSFDIRTVLYRRVPSMVKFWN